MKHFDLSVQHVPGWTGFHATISSRMSLPTTAGNCRSIPAAPTDMDAIYTMLYNVHKMLSKLNQNHQVLTVDERIYEIAKEVQWKVSPQFEDMIIRLGGFHLAKNFLGVIGRRMEENGTEQILEELFGPSQISSILKGSKYNRGIAAHKSLVEMLLRRKWKSFREWAEQKNDDSLNELIGDIDYQIKNFTSSFADNNNLKENHQLCLQLEAISACFFRLNVHWIQFGQFGSRLSKSFQYWDEYVSMVLLLFDFIEAEREANWDIHLECFKQMLPYDRTFDHAKYFKWGLIYVIDMLRLPQEAPEVYTAFKEGNHSVSRSKTVSKFNRVSTDMALEQGLNRGSKMKGEIIGVSHDENAVEKWTITAHLRAAVTSNFKVMSELRKNEQL